MAKLLASEASWEAANACLDTHGGFGFAEEYDVERKFRENRLYMSAPIHNNLILAYLGQHVLGLPKSYRGVNNLGSGTNNSCLTPNYSPTPKSHAGLRPAQAPLAGGRWELVRWNRLSRGHPAGDSESLAHPRTIGWVGTTALAMGGSNQSLFLIGALVDQPGQRRGSAARSSGCLLSWVALPGWTELILMWPNRVGGIAATCAEAFRPYSPVLANLTGVCYWWGWVPTCGLTALLSASALHAVVSAGHPGRRRWRSASSLVFTVVNLCGVKLGRRGSRCRSPSARRCSRFCSARRPGARRQRRLARGRDAST